MEKRLIHKFKSWLLHGKPQFELLDLKGGKARRLRDDKIFYAKQRIVDEEDKKIDIIGFMLDLVYVYVAVNERKDDKKDSHFSDWNMHLEKIEMNDLPDEVPLIWRDRVAFGYEETEKLKENGNRN